MTPVAPTWDVITDFLGVDGWKLIPGGERGGGRSRHLFYSKQLPDGRVLQTHVSHSGDKSPGAGRFSVILSQQLEISKDDFWEALRSRKPVDRPVPLDVGPVALPLWVMAILTGKLHLSADVISELSADDALALVHEYQSRPTAL